VGCTEATDADGTEFVECFFGVLCAGAIPVPMYPPVRLGRLEEYRRNTAAMLQAVDAIVVVTDQRIRRFLGVAVDISAPRLGCVTASSLGNTDSVEVEVDVSPDDVALIQFSSGTNWSLWCPAGWTATAARRRITSASTPCCGRTSSRNAHRLSRNVSVLKRIAMSDPASVMHMFGCPDAFFGLTDP
jgi:acyl-CoA synthetase (AMP-forming)/AMP-acid ligase II